MAQVFAERYPARVDTLFISNSLTDVSLIAPAFPPADELAKMPPGALRAQISGQMANWDAPEKIFVELRQLLLRELARNLPPRAPKLRLAALLRRRVPPLPAVPDSRIVIIDCHDDPLIPPAVRDDVRARHPAAEQHSLLSGGHFPYLTRSAAYNDILTKRLLAN